MRSDMDKVIVERPRNHSEFRFHQLRNLKKNRAGLGTDLESRLEDLSGKLSMNPQALKSRGIDRKELNENLRPLRRFLRANVGRLWNDVYSEICKVLGKDGTVQKHVFDHLKFFVENSPQRNVDGKLVGADFCGTPSFYVDSEGVLNNGEKFFWRQRSVPESPNLRWLRKGSLALFWARGVWYEVEISEKDRDYWRFEHVPLSSGGGNGLVLEGFSGWPRDFTCKRKCQLGKKELRKRGLK